MKKVILKIVGMHCTSCAINIDGDLEDSGKVKSAKTNYAKAITEVEFDPTKISESEIIAIIKQTGYKVEPQ